MIRSLKNSGSISSRKFRSDLDILEGIRNNDNLAFEWLYEHNFHRIKSFILGNQGKHEDVKDIIQEGIIALWQNVKMGKFTLKEETKISSYLFRVCKNRWYEKLKSAGFRKTMPMGDHTDRPTDEDILQGLMKMEEIEYIRRLFQKLSDKCQQLLTWFYYENRSMEEIADLTGNQLKSVKNEKYRCMVQLKKLNNQESVP